MPSEWLPDPTPMRLKAKYKLVKNSRFKAHYDHQGGIAFRDEHGVVHQVPNKNRRKTTDSSAVRRVFRQQ